MPKLHARVSVEIDVSDKKFAEIIERSHGLKREVVIGDNLGIDWNNARPCDWDDGGYIPPEWLEYDAEEAGYEIKEDDEI